MAFLKGVMERLRRGALSRGLYLLLFSLHLVALTCICVLFVSFKGWFGEILGVAFYGGYMIFLHPQLILVHNLVGFIVQMPTTSFFDSVDSALPWTIPVCFVFGWLTTKIRSQKDYSYGYLLLNMLIFWILSLAIVLLLFRSQLGE